MIDIEYLYSCLAYDLEVDGSVNPMEIELVRQLEIIVMKERD